MPLVNSKSKAAVGENIKREMDAGKPQKQAVAIALSVQRRAKGYADGGVVGVVNAAVARSKERIDAADNATGNALATPPAAPKPVTAGNGVTAAEAEARFKQLTAPEAPKPQEKSWLDRAKAAIGMKNGGKVKCAAGGKVTGPGTGRSDSIPARLSNGEYVLPADTAKKVGYKNLDALKAKTHMTPMQRKMARK